MTVLPGWKYEELLSGVAVGRLEPALFMKVAEQDRVVAFAPEMLGIFPAGVQGKRGFMSLIALPECLLQLMHKGHGKRLGKHAEEFKDERIS